MLSWSISSDCFTFSTRFAGNGGFRSKPLPMLVWIVLQRDQRLGVLSPTTSQATGPPTRLPAPLVPVNSHGDTTPHPGIEQELC